MALKPALTTLQRKFQTKSPEKEAGRMAKRDGSEDTEEEMSWDTHCTWLAISFLEGTGSGPILQ